MPLWAIYQGATLSNMQSMAMKNRGDFWWINHDHQGHFSLVGAGPTDEILRLECSRRRISIELGRGFGLDFLC